MVSTLPADREPPADATQPSVEDARLAPTQMAAPGGGDPPVDPMAGAETANVLDTPAAGATVIRGSILRVGGYGLGMLATVVSSAVVIRHLGLVDTGRFTTVTALVAIVATISDLGLTGIAVREYSLQPSDGEARRFLKNLLGIRMTIALSGLAVATGFCVLVGYPGVMVAGTAIAGAGMLLFVAQDGCSVPLQVKLRFGWVAGLQLAIQTAMAIEAVLLSLAGVGLLPFFALQLPVVAPVLAITIFIGGRDSRLLPVVNLSRWRQMIGRILPYSAAVVLSVVYFQIAQIMVSLLSSSAQTGYFGVSFRVLLALTTLPPLLVSTSLPLLARAARDDEQRFAYAGNRLAETMLVAGCGLALALCLGAPFAVRVVAGPGFEAAADVLRIQAFALMGTFVISARGYALLSLDRLRAMLSSNAVALIVVMAAGVPLIEAYGSKGAAVAMVMAELTLAMCYEWSITRERPGMGLGAPYVLKVAVALLISGGIALALGVGSFATAVFGSLLYVAAALVLGIVPAEIRQALLHRQPATRS